MYIGVTIGPCDTLSKCAFGKGTLLPIIVGADSPPRLSIYISIDLSIYPSIHIHVYLSLSLSLSQYVYI